MQDVVTKPDQVNTDELSHAILTASMSDIKNIPKLLVPQIGGVKVLNHSQSFKCTQSLLCDDGSRFTRVNF